MLKSGPCGPSVIPPHEAQNVRLEPKLDVILSVLILAFTIPAWAYAVESKQSWSKLWRSVFLVTASLFLAMLFVNLITFGPLRLDWYLHWSLRFAALGATLSILALILVREWRIGGAPIGVGISCGLSLAMWWFLITLH
jgi:hypothetical protein